MVSQYQEFLKEKDAQLQQMETLRLKLTQELIEKQTAIDSLQHRPIPKPRTHVVDPQIMQQIAELKQQLDEARQQLQREKNFREISEQWNRNRLSKLEKMVQEAAGYKSRLQTAEVELERKTEIVSD